MSHAAVHLLLVRRGLDSLLRRQRMRDSLHFSCRDIAHPVEGHVDLKLFDLEEQAFEHEKHLIAFWGRREGDDNGLLLNISTGGPGAPGVPASEKKIKASKKLAQKLGKKWGPINGAVMGRKSAEEKAISAVVTDPDGIEQTVTNLSRFCRKHGFDSRQCLGSASLVVRKQ